MFGSCGTRPFKLGPLGMYDNLTVVNLGVKMDSDFKLVK